MTHCAYAPIVLFAFNRPNHLRRTLDALAANELASESDVFLYCDGPRKPEESSLTDAVYAVAHGAEGFRSCTVIKSERNKGLAKSVIAGVSEVIAKHERIIVLEDDLLTSPYFIRYMNEGLTVYAEEPRVASIHGYCFPHAVANPPETFFLPGADCLGWATWRRAWKIFEPAAAALLAQLDARGLRRTFNLNNSYPYYEMLEDVRDGKVSSWAVRWHASTFLAGMYTLHPGRSLVFHAGNDSSGTNCGIDTILDTELATAPIAVQEMDVKTHPIMAVAFRQFCLRISGGRWALFKRRVKRFLQRVGGKL